VIETEKEKGVRQNLSNFL